MGQDNDGDATVDKETLKKVKVNDEIHDKNEIVDIKQEKKGDILKDKSKVGTAKSQNRKDLAKDEIKKDNSATQAMGLDPNAPS